jgi:hypothetical protein
MSNYTCVMTLTEDIQGEYAITFTQSIIKEVFINDALTHNHYIRQNPEHTILCIQAALKQGDRILIRYADQENE